MKRELRRKVRKTKGSNRREGKEKRLRREKGREDDQFMDDMRGAEKHNGSENLRAHLSWRSNQVSLLKF